MMKNEYETNVPYMVFMKATTQLGCGMYSQFRGYLVNNTGGNLYFERWKMKHLEEYYYDTTTVDSYDGTDAESTATTMQIPTSNDKYRRGEVI